MGVFGAEQIKLVAGQPFMGLTFEGYNPPHPTLVFGAVLPFIPPEGSSPSISG
jgi:hypothetical protein